MEKLVCFAVLSMGIFHLVTASCPAVCKCSTLPPACPPGVSAVADRCGCCKVCAAQLNEDCGPTQPCDHHKGLKCNYGNSASREHGICRAKVEGRSCEYSGRLYQNGESFRVGCKHHCTCVDGGVGCMPLCPVHVPLATPDCPAPHHVKVPGQCCPTVGCHKKAVPLPPAPRPAVPYPYAFSYSFPYKSDKILGNELPEMGKKWEKKQAYKTLAGVIVKEPEVWPQTRDRCIIKTTEWSPCSRSCGTGVSSRVTNDNALCKLVNETRLCTVRPCGAAAPPPKKGKKCSRLRKSPERRHLTYGGCRSVQLYRPNYCGTCTDGRCCMPHRSHTASVIFACPDGRHFERKVMFVLSCKCAEACSYPNEVALEPHGWRHGDANKSLD